jgi:ADP-ribose pyrophosphatase YjhB (NUDIX family)
MFDSDRFYQACVIPYRVGERGVEFCLITSKKSGKWSLPKGTIRPEETVSDTIIRQARKEAGLQGELLEPPVGSYTYHKWETILEVVVMRMLVSECEDDWPDAECRKRCWVSGEKAIELLNKEDHKKLLKKAIALIG